MSQTHDVSLHEFVRNHDHLNEIELLPVPVPFKSKLQGEPITLLRSKSMPYHAFLVWERYISGRHMSAIAFTGTQGTPLPNHYSLVCLCCKPEQVGLLPPATVEDLLNWEESLSLRWSEAIILTCEQNGIRSLFTMRAGKWQLYDREGHVNAYDSSTHRRILGLTYLPKTVERALQFIDHRENES